MTTDARDFDRRRPGRRGGAHNAPGSKQEKTRDPAEAGSRVRVEEHYAAEVRTTLISPRRAAELEARRSYSAAASSMVGKVAVVI